MYKFNLSKRKVVKDENFQNRQKITHWSATNAMNICNSFSYKTIMCLIINGILHIFNTVYTKLHKYY